MREQFIFHINAVAQELKAHGFELYYFQSKKQGELDFLIEYKGSILPIEVKSGKTYTRHHALDNVMNNTHYETKYFRLVRHAYAPK